MSNATMSASQIEALEIATRVTSVTSVLGSTFIIFTFLRFPFFRKPINRLVFFATWGNLMANIATLMSRSPLPADSTSPLSSLCEFQGVLIQWFMMADSLWVLCMATNVFLVFFYGYDAKQLRQLEKWYLLFAYGIPMIPALTYVILDHAGHQIIGSANIWCWVSRDVDWMRITFFYAPVWIVIVATMTIYVITGVRIFKKRSELRSFSRQSGRIPVANNLDAAEESSRPSRSNSVSTSAGKNIIVTTQIKYAVQEESAAASDAHVKDDNSIRSCSSTSNLNPKASTDDDMQVPLPAAPAIRAHQFRRGSGESQCSDHGHNGYSATAFGASSSAEAATHRPQSSYTCRPERRNSNGNAAAMAYLNVAFLMFVALFVVWVPSTVNRLWQYIHKEQSYPLNIISAIVLPLQGAWNATIYVFTTRAECKRAYGLIISKFTGKPASYQPPDLWRKDSMTNSRNTRDSEGDFTLDDILKQGGTVRTNPC